MAVHEDVHTLVVLRAGCSLLEVCGLLWPSFLGGIIVEYASLAMLVSGTLSLELGELFNSAGKEVLTIQYTAATDSIFEREQVAGVVGAVILFRVRADVNNS